jgi:type III restriction enzyme
MAGAFGSISGVSTECLAVNLYPWRFWLSYGDITPPLFNQDDLRRRLVVTLNLGKVVQHMWESIIPENTESMVPVFDTERPIVSTGDMRTRYTGKPCEFTKRSHVNFCVYDSTWESADAYQLNHNDNVDAWVKNDHLGF